MYRSQDSAPSVHPDENQIVDLLAGTVADDDLPSLRAHLRHCHSCASLFAVLTADRPFLAQPEEPASR